MQLSIIIVNWNVRELIRSCLQSISREMRLPRSDYEVIVIDNASHDGSVAMLRSEFPAVTLIESKVNLGFGAGCNRAYARSRGEFVLLLNPDTEVIDHVIDELMAVLRSQPRAGIVAPRLVNADGSFQRASGGALPTLRNVAWNYLFLGPLLPRRLAPAALFMTGDPQGLQAVEWVSGASMLVRREAVGDTLFDESFFMFGEDMDLCDRVQRQGWQVLYSAPHSIVHHHGKSFDQQQAVDIRASAHLGPRRVFAQRHGRTSLWAYDAILLAGFAVRWPLYLLMSWLRPGAGYADRARFSRDYVFAMFNGRPRRAARPERAA